MCYLLILNKGEPMERFFKSYLLKKDSINDILKIKWDAFPIGSLIGIIKLRG